MIYMIGIHQGIHRNVTGFRLYEVNTGRLIDIKYDKLLSMLLRKRLKIENLTVKDGDIDINRFELYRYSVIKTEDNRYAKGHTPISGSGGENLVVIGRGRAGVYTCVNSIGHKYFVTKKFLLESSSLLGSYGINMANGKVGITGDIKKIDGANLPIGEYSIDKIDKYIYNYYKKCKLLGIYPLSFKRIGDYVEVIDINTDAKNITIPSFVKGIGRSVFYECPNLEHVGLPSGLEYIGNFNFVNCHRLRKIEIPDSVKFIGEEAFEGCINLELIELPNSLREIKSNSFKGCIKLDKVKMPDKLRKICGGSFERCESLRSITIPETVAEIENFAFLGCKNIETAIIKNKSTMIGKGAFKHCKKLNIMIS